MKRFLAPLCGVALVAAAAQAQDIGAQAAQVLQKHGPSIVTVKIVLKTEIQVMGQAQDREERMQVQGAVVDASGLIMFTNSSISSSQLQEAITGMMEAQGQEAEVEIKATPSDIKVVFGNEETEHEAFLAATDTRLDLAFVQVKTLGDLKLTPIQFGDASPAVGQTLVAVSRLDEGYDYAPFFETAQVTGEIKKPQPAFILSSDSDAVGLPVFSPTGDVLGVLTVVASGMRSEGGGLMSMVGGGNPVEGSFRTFVVPAKEVRAVVAQAKERAAEAAKQGSGTPPPAPGGAPSPQGTPPAPGGGGQ